MATNRYDLDTNYMLCMDSNIQVDNDHDWGRELIFHLGTKEEPYTLKLLELEKPHVLSSYHKHENIHETLVVLAGVVSLRVESPFFRLYYPGQSIDIQPLQRHQFFAVQDSAILMEGSDRIDPNDDIKDTDDRAGDQFIGGD